MLRMTPDDYQGYERERIAGNPKLQLAWDIAQIVDDNAPIGWWKHLNEACCLMNIYKIEKKI